MYLYGPLAHLYQNKLYSKRRPFPFFSPIANPYIGPYYPSNPFLPYREPWASFNPLLNSGDFPYFSNINIPQYLPVFNERIIRQFPPVHPEKFIQSAKTISPVIEDIGKVVNKISSNWALAERIMNAAQESKPKRVLQYLRETGLRTSPAITFNPDGIHLIFKEKYKNEDCCRLEIVLRW